MAFSGIDGQDLLDLHADCDISHLTGYAVRVMDILSIQDIMRETAPVTTYLGYVCADDFGCMFERVGILYGSRERGALTFSRRQRILEIM